MKMQRTLSESSVLPLLDMEFDSDGDPIIGDMLEHEDGWLLAGDPLEDNDF